jgi:hypothetical protein
MNAGSGDSEKGAGLRAVRDSPRGRPSDDGPRASTDESSRTTEHAACFQACQRRYEDSYMSSREERRAQNEAIFRRANEAIKRNAPDSEPILPLTCECGTAECLEKIKVAPAEFEAVHSHPARFLLAVGHQDESERVLDEFDRFSVVEKTGAGRAVVE